MSVYPGRAIAALPPADVVATTGRDIPTLVAEGVSFFVVVVVCYLFVGVAAGFVEAQWGALGGSGRAGSHVAAKIGQLGLAAILALLVYPLVQWVAGVLMAGL